VIKTPPNADSAFSASLKSCLQIRIKESWETYLTHLLEFLYDLRFLLEKKLDTITNEGNRSKVNTLAATLLQRLLGVTEHELEDESQLVSITSTSVRE